MYSQLWVFVYREFEDVLARAVPAAGPVDQSGAFNLGGLIKGAAKLFFREDGEMLSRRSVPVSQSPE